ncbi:MAG TPA: type II toxin-antitoxin system antitoxin SocA domain-containing protein, partial [Niastella sp.]
MAYPASLIAFAFVKKGIEEGKFVTQMKLQKLVYFAQGYHLAKYHTPLIKENFQAWKYGPVIPEIYNDFKLYGSQLITDTASFVPSESYTPPFSLDAEAIDTIKYTWDVLKDFSAMALSNWTHQPNAPWSKVYDPDVRATPISNDEIKNYF